MFGFRRKPAAPPALSAAETAAQWRNLGNEALGQGRLADADDCYRRAAEADPSDPVARVNLGYVLIEQDQADAAAEALEQAVTLASGQRDTLADAHFLLAGLRQRQGRTDDAMEHHRAALGARPAFAEAAQELVPWLVAQGHAAQARTVAEKLAAAAPTPQALMLLAQAVHALGHTEEAIGPLDAILRSEPTHLGALESRGNLLLELGRADDALAAFEKLMASHGRQPDALANASAALLRSGRAEEALALTEEALRAQPRHRAALHNQCRALIDLLRIDEALRLATQATQWYPDDADLRWNLAVAQLLLGDLAAGWQAYEARWHASGFVAGRTASATTQPRWTGQESLAGRSILLFAEQGLGDSIQFLRYVPRVASLAGQVIVHVQPALAPLLRDLPANCHVLPPGAPMPARDWQCPLLSLPAAFGTTLETVPAAVPYLQADASLVDDWARLLPRGRGKRIGITWSGNPHHTNDGNRSLALSLFRQIATPGLQFVSLQPQVRASDGAALASWDGLFDAGPRLRSFADTAALLQSLDLVITVDTSVAHLAGALGRPVWILLPYSPDWRWMLARGDSPWYPTAKLYRQPAPHEWQPVLERVREDLLALA